MKRTLLACTAAAVLVITGCNKDDKQVSTVIKSYSHSLVQNGIVTALHDKVPVFDEKGRISTVTTDSYFTSDKDNILKLQSHSTSTYTYNESGHTGVRVDNTDGELDFSGIPTVTTLSFDDSWNLSSSVFELSELRSVESYTYEACRVTSFTRGGTTYENTYTVTWENGDIVSLASDAETITISYLPEENPFKEGLDPTLFDITSDNYMYRLTGSHSAHLPASHTTTFKGNTTVCRYEYKKDADGRIIEINTIPEGGSTSSYSLGIKY